MGQQIDRRRCSRAIDKTSKQGPARRPDHPAHPSFVKSSEPNRTPAEVATMVAKRFFELAGIEMRHGQTARRHKRLRHET